MSTDREVVKRRTSEILANVFQKQRSATEILPKATDASVKIQKVFRGARVKFRFLRALYSCRLIQRMWRGFMGRLWVQGVSLERSRKFQVSLFSLVATTIQRYFRGFWSRRHIHDYYARKKYLEKVRVLGERTVNHLGLIALRINEEKTAILQEEKKHEYKNLTCSLHHLLSTKKIPGIYNPPYPIEKPKVDGVPVEDSIRENTRPILLGDILSRYLNKKTSEIEKSGNDDEMMKDRLQLISRTANVGRQKRIQGPFMEYIKTSGKKFVFPGLSIQASSKFGIVDESASMERKLNKWICIGTRDFVAKRHISQEITAGSVLSDSLYFCHSPDFFRENYSEIGRIIRKDFLTAIPRNRFLSDYHYYDEIGKKRDQELGD